MVRNDLLCNNDSEFVCICQQNAGNLLKYYILCNELIELDELPVIEMNIRRVNLSARLHTNETYESYFKRRIAAVVSNYCEQQADECMAATLRLKKENVVLLNIKPNSLQSTIIGFVITKSQRRSVLSTMTILDSTKVKYVLSAQLAALSRILGGVRIEQVEMVIMKKYRDTDSGETTQRDNLGLLVILSITAAFLTTTYTVAAIRVCRSCYAKRQAKKRASKLNKTSETPNYGTCIQPKQNEMHRNYEIHSTIKTKTFERNNPNNLNSGEIAVMDLHQMRRMFQCDPSQLPAEEALALSTTSNDLFVMYAAKFFKESKLQINDSQPKNKIRQSRKTEAENKNFSLLHKTDKISQKTRDIVEVPQKYTNILAKNEEIVGAFSPSDTNSITYFYQSEYEFSNQQDKVLPIPIWNQLTVEEPSQSTCNQPETTSELTNSNSKKLTIDEHLETIQNQLAIGNESTWLPNKESRDKSYSLTSSFSESSFDEANHCNAETINLELFHQSNRETKRGIKTEIVGLKRVSLTDKSNYPQPEYSDCFTKDDKHIHFIRKSQTAHQFDNWSSESDDEGGDVYHKLSEADEEKETDRNLELASVIYAEKVKDFIEDSKTSQNEKNFELNSNIQSFTYTKQIKINAGETYYELQKSSIPPNSLNLSSISNKFTSKEFVSFSSTDDLK
ncbi:ATP-dependent RNA helicase [Dirofilaria immitis]